MKIGTSYSVQATLVASAICSIVLLAGCTTTPARKQTSEPVVLQATYTPEPVKIDGILNDTVWRTARTYPLSLGQNQVTAGEALAGPGDVQLAWDDKNFYLAITFHDSDIIAEGEEDQLHHYLMGDVVELFLKPEGKTWYWELYATPAGRKTSFWYPGRGRLGLESAWQYECGLRVGADIKGTLNTWEDRDLYWTAEMAMPIEDLTSHGDSFRPDSDWRILIARYNYSRYLPAKELSMAPRTPYADNHRYEEYGTLELVK
jgi:hypothetical protein